MTETDVTKQQGQAVVVKQLHSQAASSQLITSSVRKHCDKRRAADAQSDVTSPSKRCRAAEEEDVACCAASHLEDQENAQDQGIHLGQQQHLQQLCDDVQQEQQHCGEDCAPDAAKGGTLTTIFSPLYLLYQGGHQLAQHIAASYAGQQPQPDMPHGHDHHHLLPLTPDMQQRLERQHQEVARQQQEQQEEEEDEQEQQQQRPARAANSSDSSEPAHTSSGLPRPPTPLCSASTCSPDSACTAKHAQSPQHPTGAAAAAAVAAAADDDDEEDEDCFDPYLFISRLPPLEECAGPGPRHTLLPRRTRAAKQKTLVLDLDETLVHSTLGAEPPDSAPPDFSFPVVFNGMQHMVHVRQRPHMLAFLERVAMLYEVVIFTASQKLYAEKLLNILDSRRRLIRHRIYRDSCVLVDGNYLKDLSVLGRDLAHTLIVDNSPQAFGFQLDNGVPIESWYDDAADDELLRLLPFLEQLATVDDVRPHISRRFRLRDVVRGAAADVGGLLLRP